MSLFDQLLKDMTRRAQDPFGTGGALDSNVDTANLERDVLAMLKQQTAARKGPAPAPTAIGGSSPSPATDTATLVSGQPQLPEMSDDSEPLPDDMEHDVRAMLEQQAKNRAAREAKSSGGNSSPSPAVLEALAKARASMQAAGKHTAIFRERETRLLKLRDKAATLWESFLKKEFCKSDALEVVTPVSSPVQHYLCTYSNKFFGDIEKMDFPVNRMPEPEADSPSSWSSATTKTLSLRSLAYVHSKFLAQGLARVEKFRKIATEIEREKQQLRSKEDSAAPEDELPPEVALATMDIHVLAAKLAFARGDFVTSAIEGMDGLKAARRERRRQDKLQQQSRLYRAKDGPPQLDETQLACSSAELLKYEESAWTMTVRAMLFLKRGFIALSKIASSWVYQKGDTVTVAGLQSESATKYNGQKGRLTTFKFDSTTPRWGVKLFAHHEPNDEDDDAPTLDKSKAKSQRAGATATKPVVLSIKKANITFVPPSSENAETARMQRCFVRMTSPASVPSAPRPVLASTGSQLASRVADGTVAGCGHVFLDWGNVSDFGRAYQESRRGLFQKARDIRNAASARQAQSAANSPTCSFDEATALGSTISKVAQGLLLPSTQNGEVRFAALHSAVYSPHHPTLHTAAVLLLLELVDCAAALAGASSKPLDVFFLESSKPPPSTVSEDGKAHRNAGLIDNMPAFHFFFYEALTSCPGSSHENTAAVIDHFSLNNSVDDIAERVENSPVTLSTRIALVHDALLRMFQGFLAFRTLQRVAILDFMRHSSHPLEVVHQIVRSSSSLLRKHCNSDGESDGEPERLQNLRGCADDVNSLTRVVDRTQDVLLSFSGCLSVPSVTRQQDIQHFMYDRGLAAVHLAATAIHTFGIYHLRKADSGSSAQERVLRAARDPSQTGLVRGGAVVAQCIATLSKCIVIYLNVFTNAAAVRQALAVPVVRGPDAKNREWADVVPWVALLLPLTDLALEAAATTDIDSDSSDDEGSADAYAADEDSDSDHDAEPNKRVSPRQSGRNMKTQPFRVGPTARRYSQTLALFVNTFCRNILELDRDSAEAVNALSFINTLLGHAELKRIFVASGSSSAEWHDFQELVKAIRSHARRRSIAVDNIATIASAQKKKQQNAGADSAKTLTQTLLQMPKRSQKINLPSLSRSGNLPELPSANLKNAPPLPVHKTVHEGEASVDKSKHANLNDKRV